MPRTAYWWYRSERYGLVDRSRSNQLRAGGVGGREGGGRWLAVVDGEDGQGQQPEMEAQQAGRGA